MKTEINIHSLIEKVEIRVLPCGGCNYSDLHLQKHQLLVDDIRDAVKKLNELVKEAESNNITVELEDTSSRAIKSENKYELSISKIIKL